VSAEACAGAEHRQVDQLRARVAAGVPKATVARESSISRETLYTYLRTQPGAAPDVELDTAPAADQSS
jgi:DNA-binding phage protein